MKNNLPISINDAVNQATQVLSVGSDSPRLDAELLVAAVLQRSRSWLFAHWEQLLTQEQQCQLETLMVRRRNGEPMAYILEHKEFWGLKLTITPSVLTPRPETELIVEWILANFPENAPLQLADLGTGSGAIALSLAFERSQWHIDATDYSAPALALAQQNARQLQLTNVNFLSGDWCAALPAKQYHLLVSNPPYIAEQDSHLQHLSHEPSLALVAGPDGLDAIRNIIHQAPDYLVKSGCLVLEHGYDQAPAVAKLLRQQGFTDIQTHFDLAKHPRFVTARR